MTTTMTKTTMAMCRESFPVYTDMSDERESLMGKPRIHSGIKQSQYSNIDLLDEEQYVPLGWEAKLINAGSAATPAKWQLHRTILRKVNI